ncbi:MAG: FkbM family methyltransferase [Planctomycetota bacterium]
MGEKESRPNDVDRCPRGHTGMRKEFSWIIKNDKYRIKDYPNYCFDYIFDLGATFGTFSIIMKARNPDARVIAIEPCYDTFQVLRNRVHGLGIEVQNIALGDGLPCYFVNKNNAYRHLCVPFQSDETSYKVESKTLTDIFFDSGCSLRDKYFLKIDCEMGERFMIGDFTAEQILLHAVQVGLVIHFRNPGTLNYLNYYNYEWNPEYHAYNEWIHDLFEETHEIEYYKSRKKRGYGHFCMRRL